MFLVDFRQGRLIPDEEVNTRIRQPASVRGLAAKKPNPAERSRCGDQRPVLQSETILARMQTFGYTTKRSTSC